MGGAWMGVHDVGGGEVVRSLMLPASARQRAREKRSRNLTAGS